MSQYNFSTFAKDVWFDTTFSHKLDSSVRKYTCTILKTENTISIDVPAIRKSKKYESTTDDTCPLYSPIARCNIVVNIIRKNLPTVNTINIISKILPGERGGLIYGCTKKFAMKDDFNYIELFNKEVPFLNPALIVGITVEFEYEFAGEPESEGDATEEESEISTDDSEDEEEYGDADSRGEA